MNGPTGCSPHCLGTETISGTRLPLPGTAGLVLGPLRPWDGGASQACSLASPKPLTDFPVRRTPSSGNVAFTVTPHGKDTPGAKTRKQAPTGTPEDRPAPTGTPRNRPAPIGTPGQTSPQWDPRIDQPPLGPHVATASSPLRAHTSALCLPVGGILIICSSYRHTCPDHLPCALLVHKTRRSHVECKRM